ncbi:response regulator receiver modulated diguanylate cyclase [Breoghania corrubedonensis]|uniref:diguanylate cyclase n=1 Tax=Breoghania corrubedonensis TaxID=665038 RepID=A0A2T5VCJ0_9HYPH|nr:PleD family two-component system response regulator [Breoghania corrubedonensis]PTW61471.1 response regulator receiver modulated diguanylate cyclase [Breoghania corrubedonensis]
MTARILVVDDIPANVKLLQARLLAEYFEVLTATSGPEALEICDNEDCDIILLDVMMPGMDGFEVCRRLKANPEMRHVPVIMVTALDQPADRVRGLEAGADDFLTKPISEIALIARVKNLVRLKRAADELRMRAHTSREMGLDEMEDVDEQLRALPGKALLVDDRRSSFERIAGKLSHAFDIAVETNPEDALFRIADGDFDLVLLSLSLDDFDSLRLCSQLRSLERTRTLPILLIVEPEDEERLLRGLEIGVNDYILRPIDTNELTARARTQIRRKRFGDRLRDSVQETMQLAVTDDLTGLHNRRYLLAHLESLFQQAQQRRSPLTFFICDIDYFKAINDTHGHDAGDEVLKEFARRLRRSLRGPDLVCRYGGEEFVIVMPDTDLSLAYGVAERVRKRIAGEPFIVQGGAQTLDVTVSVGVAAVTGRKDTVEQLIKRADTALYAAKRDGRNRVVADAA